MKRTKQLGLLLLILATGTAGGVLELSHVPRFVACVADAAGTPSARVVYAKPTMASTASAETAEILRIMLCPPWFRLPG